MTHNLSILIDDADRERYPKAPWTASLSIGAQPTGQVEAVGRGNTPSAALMALLTQTDLLDSEPEDCPDCGVVKGTEAYRTWHDPDGNCHAHRRPV